mgnify:CR=1 FL=1
MNKLHVDDLSIGELSQSKYDIAFFSCGYEERCIDVATRLHRDNIDNVVVLAFDQHKEDSVRIDSLNYFSESWTGFKLLEISQREISKIQRVLSEIIEEINVTELKILIDYTSMSRAWYASILNYLVNFCELRVTVDLTYATALYSNLDLNV